MDNHDAIESRDVKSEVDNKPHDRHAPATDDNHSTPKKRRKVNHGKYSWLGALVQSDMPGSSAQRSVSLVVVPSSRYNSLHSMNINIRC